jgi:hypothetical protein
MLGESAFSYCSTLRSICIPSLVEAIHESCFAGCETLSSVAFAPTSQISTLADLAFSGCFALQSICLPASLCRVSGLAMAVSGIKNIDVDLDNLAFCVSDDFLVDFAETCLIRNFGNGGDVVVWEDVETISTGCFNRCDSIVSVTFESDCCVSRLGESALEGCSSLRSVVFLHPSKQSTSPVSVLARVFPK